MKRPLIVAALATLFVAGMTGVAHADYTYLLSGLGEFKWTSSINQLYVRDLKNGDHIEMRYAFTNTVCGTSGNACAPSSSSLIRLDDDYAGYTEYHYPSNPNNRTYILLKICNDDFPPDTCSAWKRSTS